MLKHINVNRKTSATLVNNIHNKCGDEPERQVLLTNIKNLSTVTIGFWLKALSKSNISSSGKRTLVVVSRGKQVALKISLSASDEVICDLT